MSQLKRQMTDGRKDLGSQTYEQHLGELVETDQITAETRRLALPQQAPDPKTATVSYSRRGPGKAVSK